MNSFTSAAAFLFASTKVNPVGVSATQSVQKVYSAHEMLAFQVAHGVDTETLDYHMLSVSDHTEAAELLSMVDSFAQEQVQLDDDFMRILNETSRMNGSDKPTKPRF